MALVDNLGDLLDNGKGGGIVLTSVDALIDWSRGKSLWSMPTLARERSHECGSPRSWLPRIVTIS
jgi:hypothetical protein